jgi:sugar O-acyltransferase (sialic acid O-acetyltransferase NeuD family)
VIFGAGDVAQLAHRYFTRDAGREVVAFTVDRAYRTAEVFLERPLVAFEDVADRYPPAGHDLFVALSFSRMNQLRAERFRAARTLGYHLPSYVSPRCSFLTDTPVGQNCFILEDNTIQPFVTIGDDVTLWSGNHVGHSAVIEDHAWVSSQVVIAGHVRIRPYCFLGVNATLGHGLTLAPRTLVGAGAVLTHDTAEGDVWVPPRAVRLDRTSDQVDL